MKTIGVKIDENLYNTISSVVESENKTNSIFLREAIDTLLKTKVNQRIPVSKGDYDIDVYQRACRFIDGYIAFKLEVDE